MIKKHCLKCLSSMTPEIYSDPDIDPRKVGNPWMCPECGEMYGCKDGTSYIDHIDIVRQYNEARPKSI